jgi:hypothetical protein
MCGGVQDYQHTKQFSIRLLTNGSARQIDLQQIFYDCEEVWLDEYHFVNKGGAAGGVYLDIQASNFSQGTRNNENRRGVLLSVDNANSHVVYQRPKVVVYSSCSTLQNFELSIETPTGQTVTFDEVNLHFTVLMRKPKEAMVQHRLLLGTMDWPSNHDPAKNYYAPYLK